MKKRRIALVTALSLLISFTPLASAEVAQEVLVSYATQRGMSNWIAKTVVFMKGYELAQRVSPDLARFISSGNLYALVWYGEGRVAIIQIRGDAALNILSAGFSGFDDFSFAAIQTTYPILSGVDQDGDYWEICISNIPQVAC